MPTVNNVSRPWIEARDREGILPLGADIAYISITDPDSGFAKIDPPGCPIIRLQFWDISRPLSGYELVRQDQIDDLACFIKDYRGFNFIVHCEAGICRSGAVVQAIVDTFPEYKEVHGERYPNPLVLSMLKRALGNVPIGAEE